ncbi:hypothetical protein D9615_008121 [Tricholomella constricta]|uniref:Uncharacterized protein n=1 Tax=Tricholomella constricta TaxID=117010 RepID=A0A8H5GVW9_9AGAR|nr:hypothetical protein D9615_008121 [Tricholomella constricta]
MSNSAPLSPNELRLDVRFYDHDQPVICQIPNISRDPTFDDIGERMTLEQVLRSDLVDQAIRVALEKMVGRPLPYFRLVDKDRSIYVEPPYTLETLIHGLSSSSPTIGACVSSKYLVARRNESGYDLGDILREQATRQAQHGEREQAPKTSIHWATKQEMDEELARWQAKTELMGKLTQSQTDVVGLERMANQLMSTMKEMKEMHANSEKEMKDKQARWEQEMKDKEVRLEKETEEIRGELRESKARSEMEMEEIRGELQESKARSEAKHARSEKEMKTLKRELWESNRKHARSEGQHARSKRQVEIAWQRNSELKDDVAALTDSNQDMMRVIADSVSPIKATPVIRPRTHSLNFSFSTQDPAALDRIRLRNLLHRAQTHLGLITGLSESRWDASVNWRRAFANFATPELRRSYARRILSEPGMFITGEMRDLLASDMALDLVTDTRSHIRRSGDMAAHEQIEHDQYRGTIARHRVEAEKRGLIVLLGIVISEDGSSPSPLPPPTVCQTKSSSSSTSTTRIQRIWSIKEREHSTFEGTKEMGTEVTCMKDEMERLNEHWQWGPKADVWEAGLLREWQEKKDEGVWSDAEWERAKAQLKLLKVVMMGTDAEAKAILEAAETETEVVDGEPKEVNNSESEEVESDTEEDSETESEEEESEIEEVNGLETALEEEMEDVKGQLEELQDMQATLETGLAEAQTKQEEVNRVQDMHIRNLQREVAALVEQNQDLMAVIANSFSGQDSAALDRIRLRHLVDRAQTHIGLIAGVAEQSQPNDASRNWRRAFAGLKTPELRRAHARTLLSGSDALKDLLASDGAIDLVTGSGSGLFAF